MPTGASIDNADQLKRQLHEEIERMPQQDLEAVHRIVLLVKTLTSAEQLDRDFDADEVAGRLSPEKIDQAVREARASLRQA